MTRVCARCGQRPVADPEAGRLGEAATLAVMCDGCAAEGPMSPSEAERYRARLEEEHESWPVHRPEALDAPIPGRHWYAGCEPGGDWNDELGRYTGTGPRVDPETGVCSGCGRRACPICGRENCPDHEPIGATT